MTRSPEIPSMYAFSSVGDWPQHLAEFRAATAMLSTEAMATSFPRLGEIVVDQNFFDISTQPFEEIRYPIGPDQAAIKEELLTLIAHWNPRDVRKSHPDTPIPAGSVLLCSFDTPICFIENLHYAHPRIYLLGENLDLMRQHTQTIWENLPQLQFAFAVALTK